MSNVHILRAVENIKSNTTIYTPIIEVIVNSIQAIEASKIERGTIKIIAIRSKQTESDGTLPPIVSLKITDNGIGFTQANRDSFDTFYSDHKIEIGGKGFGRFTCLKYFNNLQIDSHYTENGKRLHRVFSMGKRHEIIVNEKLSPSSEPENRTSALLSEIKSSHLSKKLSTLARSLTERLLPYFITKSYTCPIITLCEEDDSGLIVLNDLFKSQTGLIREIPLSNNTFSINSKEKQEKFEVRFFKIYSPKNQKSRISLVAHKREVTETAVHAYIPEFSDEFYDKNYDNTENKERNYIIKTYVFSEYLDNHVSLERGSFEFQKQDDMLFGISQNEIEEKAASLTATTVTNELSARQEKKREDVNEYIRTHAPWHKDLVRNADLSSLSYHPSKEEIELFLQREKYRIEAEIRIQIDQISTNTAPQTPEEITKIVDQISDASKNNLIHYVALRKNILKVFEKALELDENGKYRAEDELHNIIFPTKRDSENTSYSSHNLWIIDERLTFTDFISSDQPLNGGNTERPDLLLYGSRVAFRGENQPSNPVTIFEFKKPGRDDFANPSSKEDPIQQIIRYTNSIRNGAFKTPKGKQILISPNTPFYGYVICEMSSKVEDWLRFEKDFKQMPDNSGWFNWASNINLYIEVISWDKALKDANMRNKIFFHKLGIDI
ncbi:Histidine kinase-, DNA gyrase B-, and HSP90-like ATPase [Ectopseudomonas composti]|uniref:Histidine kinase-, DNA gyrase B-, and HSP90-like ATPase n=1 Tax=Ectopseudomonas composti TaxID=658457 RepID=A0A1I5Q823_9GAMM|nr:ATP-binding protein [Pseudomonas composti]SFP42312.1 Histidine kinase-, DNA gyrase B-, and HSP90-like ATPase [Pseudomonas composti]